MRRRWLLIVPILFFLPASVGLAYLRGGSYSARSLVMLQETVTSNPLGHETTEPSLDRMAETLKGLRALLVSDYVLGPVVDELNPKPLDGKTLNGKTRAAKIQELAKHINVDLLGNDFLEFRLTGGEAKGLGRTLQKVMTNVIAALMAHPGERAGHFVLNALEEKLGAAQRRISELDAVGKASPLFDIKQAEDQLAAYSDRKKALSATAKSQPANKVAGEPQAQMPTPAANAAAVQSEETNNALAELDAKSQALTDQVESARAARNERLNLETTVRTIQARIEGEKANVANSASTGWAEMLNAPEKMIIVDPPRDPELPSSSRLFFIASGLLGAMLLGAALVVLAEIFDTTLRREDQIAAIAGVPCLGELPLLIRASAGAPEPFGISYGALSRGDHEESRYRDRLPYP